jgi:hypothetical protein
VKRYLAQGVSASCCDYDKRSPLMVSSQEGRAVSSCRGFIMLPVGGIVSSSGGNNLRLCPYTNPSFNPQNIVKLLLAAHADVNALDMFGTNALVRGRF